MTSATTTIKLPDNLKQRIAPLAEAAGKTAHAWMVEALGASGRHGRGARDFPSGGRGSAAEIDAGGALYAAEDVAAYLLARAAARHRPAQARTQGRYRHHNSPRARRR